MESYYTCISANGQSVSVSWAVYWWGHTMLTTRFCNVDIFFIGSEKQRKKNKKKIIRLFSQYSGFLFGV